MKNKLTSSIYIVASMLLFASGQVYAEKYLTADEVKSLVVGNTMHAQHLKKDFEFSVHFDSDGNTAFRKQFDETTKTTYKFNGDKHCIFWKGQDRCAKILDNGDGTYTRINKKGKHVVKWTKVIKGKEL